MASRCASILVALGVSVLAVSGCGSGAAVKSVAKVGDSPIEKREFDRWFASAAVAEAELEGKDGAAPSKEGDFAACTQSLLSAGSRGSSSPPEDAARNARAECLREYDRLKASVMQFLLRAEWVRQEADEQGLKVTDAEARGALDAREKGASPIGSASGEYVRSSGASEEHELFVVKRDLLEQKLTQRFAQVEANVSAEELRAYYRANEKGFARPERRDVDIVLTRSRARAAEARRALDRGRSFASVARRYSVDRTSRARGGKLFDVVKGQQDRDFDAAVFGSRPKEVAGPVETQFGFYVLSVTRVRAAKRQSFGQAEASIRKLLTAQRRQTALDAYMRDFRRRYRAQTVCADGYRTSECGNSSASPPVSGACKRHVPKRPVATPDGLIKPSAQLVVSAVQRVPPQVRVEGFIPLLPDAIIDDFRRNTRLKVLSFETEGFDAEVSVTDGRRRSSWKAVKRCDTGSVFVALTVPAERRPQR